jgi:hypothetical protein
MTILRLTEGKLLIHNAIRLHDEDYADLEKIGEVAWIVAPNYLHSSEAHVYKRRYPGARLFLPKKKHEEWDGRSLVDGVLPDDWPAELRKEVDCHHLLGTRYIDESVFLHRASRTLLTADLVFNMQNEPVGLERVMYGLNRIYKRFGPSRFFKFVAIRDRVGFRESIEKILAWDFDRVIMSHGDVLDTGGREKLRAACEEMGLLRP